MVKPDIAEKSVNYALRVIQLHRELEKSSAGRVLGKQLIRSGTSVGANIQEAQAAQSKADFIAKMSIAHKEARETAYWLRLIRQSELIPLSCLDSLEDETVEIVKIISSILLTSKQNLKTSNS